MKTLVFVIFLLAHGAISVAANPPNKNAHSIEVTAEVGATSGPQLTLRMTLRNVGNSSIRMYSARLPWGNRYSLFLLGAAEDSQPLELVFPFDDTVSDILTIQPGQAVSGEVHLGLFFRGLRAELKKGPVQILWTYRLQAIDGTLSDRKSGQIVMPKSSG